MHHMMMMMSSGVQSASQAGQGGQRSACLALAQRGSRPPPGAARRAADGGRAQLCVLRQALGAGLADELLGRPARHAGPHRDRVHGWMDAFGRAASVLNYVPAEAVFVDPQTAQRNNPDW